MYITSVSISGSFLFHPSALKFTIELDSFFVVSLVCKYSEIHDLFFVLIFFRGSLTVDTAGAEDIYFVAPNKYLGDQRFAYSFALSFHLQQDNVSSPASSSKGDVILEGRWFHQPLVTSLATPPPGGNNFEKYEVIMRLNNVKVIKFRAFIKC